MAEGDAIDIVSQGMVYVAIGSYPRVPLVRAPARHTLSLEERNTSVADAAATSGAWAACRVPPGP